MPRAAPEAGCYDLAFQAAYPLGERAEVALEDYARVLTRSRGAEVVRAEDDPAMVTGIHVCGLGVALSQVTLTDIEDFARRMIAPGEDAGGLGWS